MHMTSVQYSIIKYCAVCYTIPDEYVLVKTENLEQHLALVRSGITSILIVVFSFDIYVPVRLI